MKTVALCCSHLLGQFPKKPVILKSASSPVLSPHTSEYSPSFLFSHLSSTSKLSTGPSGTNIQSLAKLLFSTLLSECFLHFLTLVETWPSAEDTVPHPAFSSGGSFPFNIVFAPRNGPWDIFLFQVILPFSSCPAPLPASPTPAKLWISNYQSIQSLFLQSFPQTWVIYPQSLKFWLLTSCYSFQLYSYLSCRKF